MSADPGRRFARITDRAMRTMSALLCSDRYADEVMGIVNRRE